MNLDCKIWIGRSGSPGRNETYGIRIEDAGSCIDFIDVTLTPEQFAAALTSAVMDCKVTLRGLDRVGMVREAKRELVPFEGAREDVDGKSAALAPFEVDGWRGDRDDLGNMHRSRGKGKGLYEVTFTRFVTPEGTPVMRGAAPAEAINADLLEALVGLRDMVKQQLAEVQIGCDQVPSMRRADAAIAKAKGGDHG